MDKPIDNRRKISSTKLLVGGIAFVSLALVSLALFSRRTSSLHLEKKSLVIKEVLEKPFQEMVSVDGTLQPLRTVVLDAFEGGKVFKKFHQDGAMLRKGDKILELENGDLQLDILNRETAIFDLITNIQHTRNLLEQNKVSRLAELADLQYRLKEAERQYSINQKLYEREVIAKQEYDKSLNEVDYLRKKERLVSEAVKYDSASAASQIHQMEVSLRQAEKNLELTQSKLKDLVITSPIHGQLSAFSVEEGQLISKGQNIGQIDDLSAFKGRVLVDETFINRVFKGQQGILRLNDNYFPVEISRVYPTVQNGQFTADVLFTDSVPQNLRRGQNITVRLELSEARKAVVVPKGSFFQSTGGQWAYVLSTDGLSAEKRPIRLGKQNPEYYEVLAGLSPGDKVVVSSYRGFDEYDIVEFD